MPNNASDKILMYKRFLKTIVFSGIKINNPINRSSATMPPTMIEAVKTPPKSPRYSEIPLASLPSFKSAGKMAKVSQTFQR